MSKRFEVEDIYLSNAILDSESFMPYRLLNLTVRVDYEQVQDLRTKGTTHEELSEMFGSATKEAFLNRCRKEPPESENQERVKITGFGVRIKTERADEKEFGWFKL